MKNLSVTASAHPQNKDITLLSVKGFIDTTTAPEFDKTFQTVLGEKKYNLIIDLGNVNYISSAGWGIFVGEIKRIRGQKGNLFLAAMTPEVREAYELLQFNTIIKSFPDVDQAVQKGFGKSLPKREAAKSRTGKGEPVGTAVSNAAAEIPSGAAVPASPQKDGFFGRIFKPWKWFRS
jgi:anti-sigma B factor antagonist